MTKSRGIRAFVPRGQIEYRFWSKVIKGSNAACWEWIGAINSGGYGSFSFRGKAVASSRVSWELHNGEIPLGRMVLHHCDNRRCVNPAHLFLGSAQDNVKDMVNKDRQGKGEQRPACKLTDLDIPKIRELRSQGVTYKRLSELFGIAEGQLVAIVQRKAWAHIK